MKDRDKRWLKYQYFKSLKKNYEVEKLKVKDLIFPLFKLVKEGWNIFLASMFWYF